MVKKEAFEVWLNHESYDLSTKDINDLISSFEDDFQGEFVKTYFDYEKFARDLLMNDWFEDGYIFRHS